ncbi:MAG: efflux RND transporter periplasmic adaptor subunit [Acidobacteriota bacterium]
MTSIRTSISSSVLLAAAGVALLVFAGCGPSSKAKRPEEEPRSVRIAAAAASKLPEVVSVSGTLAAEEQVVLGMKVAGRIDALLVDLGSQVHKGQALARLVPTDFELRVQQAEAALVQARARLGLGGDGSNNQVDRVDPEQTSVVRQAAALQTDARARRDRAKALFDQGLLPRADLDAAEATYQVADSQYSDARDEVMNREGILAQRRSELDSARQQLIDSVLLAPFDGAVRERQGTPGQYVAVGQPLVTVVRMHPLRLKLAVPERSAAKLRQGQEVRVTVDGDSRIHPGTVVRLSPAIDESNRTLMLEAEVPNQDGALRPGSFASAEIVTAADQPVVLVPKSAIVTFAGIEKVLVVENDQTVERKVRSGRSVGDRVEITEGIAAGERVVVEPGNLIGGQAVTVSN